MIRGHVTEKGIPQITLSIADRLWIAVIDTGFNGDLELPATLQPLLNARPIGQITSKLAAGYEVEENLFEVIIPFDGVEMHAEVTFVSNARILIGTRLLQRHRLAIDFPRKTLDLELSEG